MLSFKQFLIETSPQILNPKRSDYPEGDSGQQQYLQALRDTSQKQRKEAEEVTQDAESRANTLGNIETGLKVADTVADVALTAGSAVPGGAIVNAAVKGVKSAMAAGRGDYTGAVASGLDAAVPFAGKLASGVKTGGNVMSTVNSFLAGRARDAGLAQSISTGAKAAADIASVVKNPLAGGVRIAADKVGLAQSLATGAEKLGVSEVAAKAAGKGLGSVTQKATVALGQPIVNKNQGRI